MIFELKTLVDITQTGARHGDDFYKQQQQQNFYTALQTISLRANPTISRSPHQQTIAVDSQGFGSKFSGEHQVWLWRFSFEQADSHSIEFLINDFDLVPIISGLDETADFKYPVFSTKDKKYTNITFCVFDDK